MSRGNGIILALAGILCMLSVWRSAVPSDSTQLSYRPLRVAEKTGSLPVNAGVVQDRSLPRPLFSSLKIEPTDASSKGSNDGQNPNPQIPRLVGIVTEGNRGIAIISHEKKIVRVFENEKLGDWIVLKIEPRAVVLRDHSETRRLTLEAGSAQR
jgi:hypothetical protein